MNNRTNVCWSLATSGAIGLVLLVAIWSPTSKPTTEEPSHQSDQKQHALKVQQLPAPPVLQPQAKTTPQQLNVNKLDIPIPQRKPDSPSVGVSAPAWTEIIWPNSEAERQVIYDKLKCHGMISALLKTDGGLQFASASGAIKLDDYSPYLRLVQGAVMSEENALQTGSTAGTYRLVRLMPRSLEAVFERAFNSKQDDAVLKLKMVKIPDC
ncbi:hypothetical protein A9Q89_03735 [Gammaproteobacteria bacterium 53_120_T64]|nr:hypothetical protein A9Q89_03735 [Gammaproteobacteria bacterium 53_120_T64]